MSATLAVLIASGVSVASITVAQLRSNVTSIALPGSDGEAQPPGIGGFEGGFDMLIVGSDECVDTGGCPGRTEKLADFTMLVHVADDHRSAVAVSFPRDMIVPIPECPREDGSGTYDAMSAQQINASLAYGGLPCTVLTVRALTGLDIPFAGVMTFAGVREISSAIGGVPVCIDAPIDDPRSGLELATAGTHLLAGEQALQFLRTRYGVGDGSDTGRIGSQQAFLASMLRTIKQSSTLTDPAKMFSLATAATRNMALSDNLNDLTLVSMALIFKDIPLDDIAFVKYPAGSRTTAPGRGFPDEAAADDLFARIERGLPVVPDQSAPGVGTVTSTEVDSTASPSVAATTGSPSASVPPDAAVGTDPVAGATGQTAAEEVCSKANR
ncbi:MAG: hypothetical protein RI885_2472 [Actinomycetota bacterium]